MSTGIFILWVILKGSGVSTVYTIHSAEYASRQACVEAKTQISKSWGRFDDHKVYCTAKDAFGLKPWPRRKTK